MRICPRASGVFPGKDDLAALIEAAGFRDVRYRTFAGGIVALHTASAR